MIEYNVGRAPIRYEHRADGFKWDVLYTNKNMSMDFSPTDADNKRFYRNWKPQ